MTTNTPKFHYDYDDESLLINNINSFYQSLLEYFTENEDYFTQELNIPDHLSYQDCITLLSDYYVLGNYPLLGDYDYIYETIDLNDFYNIVLDSYPFSLAFDVHLLKEKIGMTGDFIEKVVQHIKYVENKTITNESIFDPNATEGFVIKNIWYYRTLLQPFNYTIGVAEENNFESWEIPFVICKEDREDIINYM